MSLYSLFLLSLPLLSQAAPRLLATRGDADCGPNSADGATKCPLGLCCSSSGHCGATSDYCGNGCQSGFGSCTVPTTPSCSGSSASGGRKVAYYQGLNANTRDCNQMPADKIPTDGLTHLLYAFASIDPNSFAVIPKDGESTDDYTSFTALASSSLKTWIALGGGSFSSGDTLTTWSDLAGDAGHRAAFISSLKDFLSTHKFSGVDLDWEFPALSDRGGKPEDVANFVTLVTEMRQGLGQDVGISIAVPTDYGDLKGYDLKNLGDQVDFINVMAYDLTGDPSKLSAQTDIRTIGTNMASFWASGVDPAKLNLGIADYGRGFKMADSSCSTIGCGANGLSDQGSCSRTDGFLTLAEIEDLVAGGATPATDNDAMVKTLTWGSGNWIAYDDDDTIKSKLGWADQHCMGGGMYWSVDFQKAK